ncbi:minor capsid protein [Anaerovorax odorimutans]|uniref:Minor capsid protein n=1 Tax=Anaerovorax odorimutans TaxID=109327 RepID=A0ABT1RPB0_9FIRM|nr:minor capsid protein [Anaerovorax odorimutans]MCQ4637022.1 minor capsid protein [Anaerovorax odorimutans]
MLGLVDVREWIETLGVGEHFYIGKLDNKKEKSVGVYQGKATGPPNIAIGGLDAATYDIKPISVLVHWTKNAKETEEAAFSLFEKILNISDLMIGQTHINYVRLMVPEPQDVGTDNKGVYERVIWFDLYYER